MKSSLHGRVLMSMSKRLVHVAVHPESMGARKIGIFDADSERCAFEAELVAFADERDALKAQFSEATAELPREKGRK